MQPLPLTNLDAPHLSTRKPRDPKKSPPHARLFSWRRATAGTITSCDQVRMGVNDRVWHPDPWVPLIRGFGFRSFSREDFSFLERTGCRSSPSMWRWRTFHSGRDLVLGHATVDFLHFVVLVLHYYDAMLPSASFLCEASKHRKAQILHPMKTVLKPKARRHTLSGLQWHAHVCGLSPQQL
jgi:hypothetical protein